MPNQHSGQVVEALTRWQNSLHGQGFASKDVDLVRGYLRDLEEQLEAAQAHGAQAEAFIAHMDMGYRWVEWLERVSIHDPNPASVEAASTDAVSPAPGHQRSDHPEPSPDTSPAKRLT